jgi:hypothetical protein
VGILNTIQSLASHLTIDDQLSLTDAAAWAWGFCSASVETDEIPVTVKVVAGGADVLVPTVDIASIS